mgnify:CR=1 FL=1
MKKSPVVHFEMPYTDAARIDAFYTKVFGWQMKQLGSNMMDYITAQTTETDENNMIKDPGAINGGFFPRKEELQYQIPSVVISVEDILIAMKNVVDAGGEVLGEPVVIPGIGQYVSIHDSEGNRVSLLQALKR